MAVPVEVTPMPDCRAKGAGNATGWREEKGREEGWQRPVEVTPMPDWWENGKVREERAKAGRSSGL